MIQAIVILMVILGTGLIVFGGYAFVKFQKHPSSSQNRLQLNNILIIETQSGSLFLIGFGIVLILAACLVYGSFANAEKTIESKDSQLEAVVQSGTALTMVPFDQLKVMEIQPAQLLENAIEEFQEIQASTFDQFLEFAVDERFAFLVLEGFAKNSFGLATIPHDRVPALSKFLRKVSREFPSISKLQLEVAKTYRTLYESPATTKDEKRHFLEMWGAVVDGFKSLQAENEAERYGISLVGGLYYQEIGQLKTALEAMLKAAEIAPQEEKHKANFNLGNIYLGLAAKEEDKEQSEKYYKNSMKQSLKSEQFARKLGIDFWQPRFNIGLIYLRTKRYEESIDSFLRAYETAQLTRENKLFIYFISTITGIDKLCEFKPFADKFPDVCESKEKLG